VKDKELLTIRRQVDTPAVCNATKVAQRKRGFQGYTKGTVLCSVPGQTIVSYAVTAGRRGLAPPTEEGPPSAP
jgi:hypothetical protein